MQGVYHQLFDKLWACSLFEFNVNVSFFIGVKVKLLLKDSFILSNEGLVQKELIYIRTSKGQQQSKLIPLLNFCVPILLTLIEKFDIKKVLQIPEVFPVHQ